LPKAACITSRRRAMKSHVIAAFLRLRAENRVVAFFHFGFRRSSTIGPDRTHADVSWKNRAAVVCRIWIETELFGDVAISIINGGALEISKTEFAGTAANRYRVRKRWRWGMKAAIKLALQANRRWPSGACPPRVPLYRPSPVAMTILSG
jgi:hypothetical protein